MGFDITWLTNMINFKRLMWNYWTRNLGGNWGENESSMTQRGYGARPIRVAGVCANAWANSDSAPKPPDIWENLLISIF